MIDLTPYCSTDEFRTHLKKPFSVGDFSYATNGHIMVRVPRQPDVPEQTKTGVDWEKPLQGINEASFSPVVVGDLPAMPTVTEQECSECEGSGKAHDCPDCNCECDFCDGTGSERIDPKISTTIRGNTYQLRYVLMMLALPGVVVADRTEAEKPLFFKFDGGVGAIMCTRGKMAEHVEIETQDKDAA